MSAAFRGTACGAPGTACGGRGVGRGPCVTRSAAGGIALLATGALLVGTALLSAPTPVGAQEEPAEAAPGAPDIRWTPEQHMQFRQVGSTTLSPDGRWVAYVVREPRMEGEESEYVSQIHVAATDGSSDRQYTRGEESASSPAFSPDGRWLAFTTSRSEESQVWVLPMAGGEAFRVTDAEAGVGSFQWFPDGRRIAYLMRDPETEEERERAEEKRDVIMVDQEFKYAHLYAAPFEPDAEEIPEATRLTEGEFHVTGFDVSPDGRRIVFEHQPDPRLNVGSMAGDLSLVEAVGDDVGAVTSLVTLGGVEGAPRFSPDGRRVAFYSTGDEPEPVGMSDLYVVDVSGGEPRRLAATPDRSPSLFRWTGDGSELLVQEALGTTRHVLAVPVDGSEPRQLTRGEGVVGAVSFDREAERMAFTWEDPDTPEDVHVSPVEGFRIGDPLTAVNTGVEIPPMGRTELLTWRSPDGRFEIEGLLTYPVDYEPGRRYPLILNVHGGPAGVYSQSFTGAPSIYMLQYFADLGYAILRPNPRGSTGYGREFRYANVADWGYGDLDDLLAGVDHVIERGVAHPDSLLLMGWSYGGYMTSFAVTRTDRFRAASMGAGLPNLVSMVTTTDIGNYLAAHMDVEFWEDYETYERHSAIYRIAEVTTPTQVIHGAEDLRVPFTQGQEFYRALQRRGVPTEMVVLPRTPHGPREPKLLMAVSPLIHAWFDRWLRAEPPEVATEGGGGR